MKMTMPKLVRIFGLDERAFFPAGKSSFVNDNEASFRRYRTRFAPRGESPIREYAFRARMWRGKKKNTIRDRIP